jgi:hypothetical protein
MTTQTTPETPANALAIAPQGDQWQVLPPPPAKDMSLNAILSRLITATDRMAEEIEKLKSMI